MSARVCVCVYACVCACLTCEKFRSHVDGRSYDAPRHHGLRLTEAQVCDLGPVLFVQLGTERVTLAYVHK